MNWPVDIDDVEQGLLDLGEDVGEEKQHLLTHAWRILSSRTERHTQSEVNVRISARQQERGRQCQG